jgi:hypothetical protein
MGRKIRQNNQKKKKNKTNMSRQTDRRMDGRTHKGVAKSASQINGSKRQVTKRAGSAIE